MKIGRMRKWAPRRQVTADMIERIEKFKDAGFTGTAAAAALDIGITTARTYYRVIDAIRQGNPIKAGTYNPDAVEEFCKRRGYTMPEQADADSASAVSGELMDAGDMTKDMVQLVSDISAAAARFLEAMKRYDFMRNE